MRIEYDPEVDALYVRLTERKMAVTIPTPISTNTNTLPKLKRGASRKFADNIRPPICVAKSAVNPQNKN